jgi:hypothetical protein
MFSVLERRDGGDRSRFLSVCVDIRKHGNLPSTLCGNMFTGLNIRCEPGLPAAEVARKIRASLNRFAEDHLDYWPTVRFAEQRGGVAKAARFLATAIDPLNGNICVTNWSRFGAYSLSFGTSRTFCFMALWDLPFPWIASISGAMEDQGVLYSIALPAKVAAALRASDANAEIHRYRLSDDAASQPMRQLAWIN